MIFLQVTKAFHNALHGAPYHASEKTLIFSSPTTRGIAEKLPLDAEFVVIHDPQRADSSRRASRERIIGVALPHHLSHPNRQSWISWNNLFRNMTAPCFLRRSFRGNFRSPSTFFPGHRIRFRKRIANWSGILSPECLPVRD